MASYLDGPDSDDDGKAPKAPAKVYTEAEVQAAKEAALALKGEGNEAFAASNFDEAAAKYTQALNALKGAGLPPDVLILLNRSASYLGLKRYVPALNDANIAAELDASNWKAHWRKGVALMAMSKRLFRSKQAVQAFEACLVCGTLPDAKVAEVQGELRKAQARLEQQEAETPPADLSKCAQA
jgi:tetratricopeptide (TPR) repeat protein